MRYAELMRRLNGIFWGNERFGSDTPVLLYEIFSFLLDKGRERIHPYILSNSKTSLSEEDAFEALGACWKGGIVQIYIDAECPSEHRPIETARLDPGFEFPYRLESCLWCDESHEVNAEDVKFSFFLDGSFAKSEEKKSLKPWQKERRSKKIAVG